MAKKVDFSLPEFKSDSTLGVPDFNFDEAPPTNDRSPAMRIATGIKKGVVDSVVDDGFIRKAIKAVIPTKLDPIFSFVDEVSGNVGNLYNNTASELKPHLDEMKRTTNRLVGEFDSLIPAKLAESIKSWTAETQKDDWGEDLTAEQYREQDMMRQLGNMFALQAETQTRQNREESVREQIRMSMQASAHRADQRQLDAIRIAVQSMQQYQSRIEVNYQRKSLELQYRSYGALVDILGEMKKTNGEQTKLLQEIKKNAGLPDYAKLKESERIKEALRNQFIGSISQSLIGDRSNFVKRYADALGQRIRGSIAQAGGAMGMGLFGVNTMLDFREMNRSMGDASDDLEDIGAFAGGWGFDKALNAAGRRVRLAAMKRSPRFRQFMNKDINRAQFGVNNIEQYMKQFADSGDFDLESLLGEKAGSRTRGAARMANPLLNMLLRPLKDTVGDMNKATQVHRSDWKDLQEPTVLTRQTARSINEVIPGFLSKIHQELKIIRTGDAKTPAMAYDFKAGKFATMSEVRRSAMSSVIQSEYKAQTQAEVNDFVNKLPGARTLTAAQREELGGILLRDNINGGLGSFERLGTASTYGQSKNAATYARLFRNAGSLDKTGALQNEMNARFQSLGSSVRDQNEIIQTLMNSGYTDVLLEAGILKESGGKFIKDDKGNLRHEAGNVSVNRAGLTDLHFGREYNPDEGFVDGGVGGRMNTTGSGESQRQYYASRDGGSRRRGSGFSDNQIAKLIEAIQDNSSREASLLMSDALLRIDARLQAGIPAAAGIPTTDPNMPLSDGQAAPGGKRRGHLTVRQLFKSAFKFSWMGAKGATSFVNRAISDSVKLGWNIGKMAYSPLAKFTKWSAKTGWNLAPNAFRGALRGANFVADGFQEAVRNTGRAAKGLWDAGGWLAAKDIFVGNERTPRFTMNGLRSGKYFDEAGNVIRSVADITGTVYDKAGKVVMDAQERAEGLFFGGPTDPEQTSADSVLGGDDGATAGVPGGERTKARSNLGRLFGFGSRTAQSGVKGAWKTAQFIGDGVQQGVSNTVNMGRRAVGAVLGGLNPFRIVGLLEEIRDVLKDRLPEDGNIREGSFEDIMAKRKAAKEKSEEDKKAAAGNAAMGGGLFGALGALFGKGKKDEEGEGDTNIYGFGGGGDGKGKKPPAPKKPVPKGFWGKVGHYGKAAAGGLWNATKWVGSTALALMGLGVPGLIGGAAKGLWNTAKFGVKAVNAVARGGLKTAWWLARGGMALLGAIGLPATLGIAAIGAAGYGLYKLFSNESPTLLDKMRMVQYGWNADDSDKYVKMRDIEKYLEDKVSFSDGAAVLNEKQIVLTELLEKFDIDPESETGESDSFRAIGWFNDRFKPIYLTHRTVLQQLANGKKDPRNANDLDKPVRLKYLNGAGFLSGPYDIRMNPFPTERDTPLPSGPAEVKAAFDAAKDDLGDVKPEDATKTSSSGAAAAAIAVGTAAAGVPKTETAGVERPLSRQLSSMSMEERNKFMRTGQGTTWNGVVITSDALKSGVPNGAKIAIASTAITNIASGESGVHALQAIRYRAYGIARLDYDKVNLFAAIEREVEKSIKFDSDGVATWDGNLRELAQQWAASFGVVSQEDSDFQDVMDWFNLRMIPVLTNYLSVIKRTVNKTTIDEGEAAMNPRQAVEAGQAMISTRSKGPNGAVAVWEIQSCPWAGVYMLNSNSKSTDGNMEALKQAVSKFELSEETAKDGAEGEKKKGFWASLFGSDDDETSRKQREQLDRRNANRSMTSQPVEGAGGAAFGMYGRNSQAAAQLAASAGGTLAGNSVAGLPGATAGMDAGMQGGNAVGAMSDGTGGMYQSLPDPTGSGKAEHLRGLIEAASAMAGVDPNMMMTMAAIESGFRYDVKAGTSSATGLYQFIKSTWDATLKKYGAKYGIPLTADPRDPKANALMGAEFLKENMRALQGVVKGRPITDTDLYMAHFLGAGGAKQFLSADPNAIAANIMPAPARANQSIFYNGSRPRTMAEVYGVLNNLVQKKGQQFGLNTNTPNIPTDTSKSTATNAIPASDANVGGGYGSSVQPTTAASSPMPAVEQTPNGVGQTRSAPSVPSQVSGGGPSYDQMTSYNQPMISNDVAIQQRVTQDRSGELLGSLKDLQGQSLKIQTDQLATLKAIHETLLELNKARGGSISQAAESTQSPKGERPSINRSTPNLPISMKRSASA